VGRMIAVEVGKMAEPERLLTPEEVAAKWLSIGRTTVYDLMRRGELRSVRIGKSRRIPASAVEAYISRLLADQTPKE
jgi:excisionase family DNA binding protein